MDLTPAKVAVSILRHHGVSLCIVGELALNYYNVPHVYHDIEICVPESSFLVAAGFLCSTGLFEASEQADDFNNYTEYKRGFPRVRTTRWTCPPQTIVIFPAAFFGLDPIERVLIPPSVNREVYMSKEVSDLSREDISNLPLPRLAPLLCGLAKKFLDAHDDMAMIAVEQLVDGMNLDQAWAQKNLQGLDAAPMTLITNQIRGKKSRIDYFSENQITCFISDKEEAANVCLIPGFE
ncbi:ser/Thr protein phosphatase [Xylariaceae sp. FL0662B]|nr:ser/Thr protein phosphatase [Xylariaceae sp. FL0662B]